jgi:hypothetical protein
LLGASYFLRLADFDAIGAHGITTCNPLDLDERNANLNRYLAGKVLRTNSRAKAYTSQT